MNEGRPFATVGMTAAGPSGDAATAPASEPASEGARPGVGALRNPIPIGEQEWPEGTVPLVSICCITYNHEPFIRQCLDGFLMQETTFPVEILIHDDASTDDTATVIREYTARHPGLIKPILQTENQYSKGVKPNATFNYPRAQGRYIAFCEGDDFWMRSDKLARQVGFLDQHPDHSLCWTRFETLDDATGARAIDENGRYFTANEGRPFGFSEFVGGWHIGTQTLVFRRAAMNPANFPNPAFRDVFLISDLLAWGPGYCLPDVTAVYRIHGGGIHSSKTEEEQDAIGARIYKAISIAHPTNAGLRRKYERFQMRQIRRLWSRRDHEGVAKAVASLFETAPGAQGPSADLLSEFTALLRAKDAPAIELDAIRASHSFRIGSAVTLPMRQVRNLLDLLRSRVVPRSVRNRAELRRRGVMFVDKGQVLRESGRVPPMAAPQPPRAPRLIVSLTTYPARIDDVFFALVSLLKQTTSPDLLLLWLAESQFPHRERDLPRRLLDLQHLGLTIRWCEDIKSYKKLVPALREFPDDVIVTADDDIYYPPEWLERLHRAYLLAPNQIHAHRAHRVSLADADSIQPYGRWQKNISSSEASFTVFPTTGGGVLYPPSSLHPDVRDEATFLRLAPHADDLWFWVMALRQGTRLGVVERNIKHLTYVNPEVEFGLTSGPTLYEINRTENEAQLTALIAHFTMIDGTSPLRRLEEDVAAESRARALVP